MTTSVPQSVALLQTATARLDLFSIGGLEQVELQELRILNARGLRASLTVSELVGDHAAISVVQDFGWHHRLLKYHYYLAFGRANRAADIFHGHYTPQLALMFPHKSVVHFHGLAVAELPLYRHFRGRFAQCNYVFCADWVRRRFHEMYPDLPEDHLHVVYNGADTTAFRLTQGNASLDTTQIAFYGGWTEPKGVRYLADVANLLAEMKTDFTLHFGGSAFGHYQDAVNSGAAGGRELGARELDRAVKATCSSSGRVLFPGWLQHSDLPTFLCGKDVGVFPSIHEDPFPLVPLEMMAAGMPVVAFDIGGVREAIIEGETGFLVPNKDTDAFARAIKLLIDNKELRLEMGAKARKRVEQYFTWDRHVDQLLEIYEQIIKRNRDRRR